MSVLTESIPSIDTPDVETFERHYLRPGRPVLVNGLVSRWPAASRWNPDYFVSEFGDRRVPTAVMPTPGDYAQAVRKAMSVADYVAALQSGPDGPATLYLGEVPMRRHFPELLEHVELPPYFPHEHPSNGVIYVGRRQFSQLHYHTEGSATLCQVYGHKRVRLYAPDQTPYLYGYPWHAGNHNMSRTTSPEPDQREFPRFSKARGFDLVIGPGQMLFIPIYWWHSIENVDLNIAVTFFWYRGLRTRWLPPSGMRFPYLLEMAHALRARGRRLLGRPAS